MTRRRATTQYLLGWVGFFVVVALIVWGATALMGDSNTGTKPRPPRTVATASDHRYARWSGPGVAVQVFTPQPGSEAKRDLKTTGTLNPRYFPPRVP
jgi:hypothetical protein